MADLLGLRIGGPIDNKAASGGAAVASQATVDAGTNDTEFVSPLKLRATPTGLLKVKNTSGFTAATGWMGYLVHTASSGIEFKSTVINTTDYASACAVVTGGADGADIWVSTRGRHPLLYSGTAPSAGDYLILSGIGAVVRQTYMSPDVVAIAMAAGAGSVVDAELLLGTKTVLTTSASNAYYVASHASTAFTATINGAPSATSVVYTPVSGNENNLPPAATNLGLLVVFNTTRGNFRLLTACNTGTNTITTVSSTDNWASTDTITITSPTIGSNVAEVDLSQASALAVIPALARGLIVTAYKLDTGALGQPSFFHPIETFAVSKAIPYYGGLSTAAYNGVTGIQIPISNRRFGWNSTASGAATATDIIDIAGYLLAVP